MSRGILAAAFAVMLFACGGGSPAVYVVALDTSPIAQLPGSCFTTGTAPTQNQSVTGVFEPQRWTHWKGPDSEYLEIPSLDSRAFKLGDADWVMVSGLVGGDGKTFTAQRVITSNQNQTPNTRTETFTFKAESLGDTLAGNLELSVVNSCVAPSCTNNVNCSASLPVTGRKVPDESVQYNP